jgi:hypothetical protein
VIDPFSGTGWNYTLPFSLRGLEINKMKHAVTVVMFATFLGATPGLAQTPVEPSVPPDEPTMVTPNAAPPNVVVPVPDDCKTPALAIPVRPILLRTRQGPSQRTSCPLVES